MAAKSMADFQEYQYFQNRSFHRAYLDGKLPCLHILCKSNCGKVFFEKKVSCAYKTTFLSVDQEMDLPRYDGLCDGH